MATLQDLLGILNTVDTAQLTAILALVSLVLIVLIYLAIRRRENDNNLAIPEPERNSRRSHRPEPAPRPVNTQARLNEAVIKPQVKPTPAPIMESAPSIAEKPMATAVSSARTSEIPAIPQDSILRRHYLANLEAEKRARANPYPTDSVLRRHYDAMHRLAVDTRVGSENPASNTTRVAPTSPKASIIEKAIGKESLAGSPAANPRENMCLPQDSVLQRHFLSQLRAEIEAGFCARPTDSVLRRHYDSLIASELKKRLTG